MLILKKKRLDRRFFFAWESKDLLYFSYGKKKKKFPHQTKSRYWEHLDSILANLDGKPDYTFDHQRSEEKEFSPRILSVSGNRELFNRLAARDYLYLKTLPILTADWILPLLLPQSVCGRSQNGHGLFCDDQGRPLLFSDATIEDVISGIGSNELGIQGRLVKIQRQELLDSFEQFLLDSLDKKRITFSSAEDPENCPFGVTFFAGVSVDPSLFFKGFILGGLMDDWKQRLKTARHFSVTLRGEPLILGGGETLLVRKDRFLEVGLNEQTAANRAFTDEELDKLRELEVIVSEDFNRRRPKPVGIFFRRMLGLGVSDDAAIVYIGKTLGTDAMYGAMLADAADTYDKFLETYTEGGHDEKLVRMVSKKLKKSGILPSDQEIRRMIYFSAKANYPAVDVSSSHRRLIQIEPGARVPTFLNHVAFVEGRKPARIPMGYNRYDSEKFYDALIERAEILHLGW